LLKFSIKGAPQCGFPVWVITRFRELGQANPDFAKDGFEYKLGITRPSIARIREIFGHSPN
jgi:hypothetical protein